MGGSSDSVRRGTRAGCIFVFTPFFGAVLAAAFLGFALLLAVFFGAARVGMRGVVEGADAVIAGIGHTLLLFADGFLGLALFEIALGVSASLISGADLALLYDSEAALERPEEEQRKVVGRLYGIRTTSEAVSAVLCSVLLLLRAGGAGDHCGWFCEWPR